MRGAGVLVGAVIAIAASGCSSRPDQVDFDSATGTAAGISTCDCTYDDGSQGGTPSLQISCAGSDRYDNIAVFFDATQVATDQTGLYTLITDSDAFSSYVAGSAGRFETFGGARRAEPGKPEIVHDLSGITIDWPEQAICDTQGCSRDMTHLAAGSLHGGHGGCEDFWATTDQETRHASRRQ